MYYTENELKKIGQNVKRLRSLKGLTMQLLADKTYLSIVTIWKLENGKGNIRPTSLNRVARALDTTIEKILQ